MSIDQHVLATLTVNSAGLTELGFGTMGVVTYKDLFEGMSAAYSSKAEAVAAGYDSDSVEVRTIVGILSQSPHVKQVKLLKGTRPPTLKYTLQILSALTTSKYKVNIAGEGFDDTTCSVTPDMGDDETDIAADLIVLLNAVVGKNYTATVDGTDPSLIYITGTLPGDWFAVEITNTLLISTVVSNVDPGIADDLDDVVVADKDFYWLYTPFGGKAIIDEVADWTEAAGFKVYTPDSPDSEIENEALLTANDVGKALAAAEFKRTMLTYHRKPVKTAGARFAGKLAPWKPGSYTAAYKTLIGASADEFTTTQTNNLDAKKVSYYKSEAGRSITWEGKVPSAEYGFLDVTVGLDFVLDGLQKAMFGVLVAKKKTAYTDEDIAEIRSAAEGFIDLCKGDTYKIVAKGTPGDEDDPEPTITFPKVKDIDPSARALRKLPNGVITFRFQGAVHTVEVEVVVTF